MGEFHGCNRAVGAHGSSGIQRDGTNWGHGPRRDWADWRSGVQCDGGEWFYWRHRDDWRDGSTRFCRRRWTYGTTRYRDCGVRRSHWRDGHRTHGKRFNHTRADWFYRCNGKPWTSVGCNRSDRQRRNERGEWFYGVHGSDGYQWTDGGARISLKRGFDRCDRSHGGNGTDRYHGSDRKSGKRWQQWKPRRHGTDGSHGSDRNAGKRWQ